jgi:hypothetical protein
MVAEMMRWHVRDEHDPGERVARARALLELVISGARPDQRVYRAQLADQLERVAETSDAALLRDDLAEVCDGGPLKELVADLDAVGLTFLADADLPSMVPSEIAPDALRAVAEAAKGVVAREQMLDYLRNRRFRLTLACAATAPIDRRITPADVRGLHLACGAEPSARPDLRSSAPATFSTDLASIVVEEPMVKAALLHLRSVWPRAMPFAELASGLALLAGRAPDVDRLAAAMLEGFAARIIELAVGPGRAAPSPPERPQATALARLCAARGLPVATLRHEDARLDDDSRRVLTLLDGTRDRAALAAEASGDIDGILLRLAYQGLLA